MKSLFKWIIVLTSAWTVGYLHNRYLDPEINWIHAIYEEKLDPARSIETSRRLLVIGGSGTHFGVDTRQLEEGLGIPSINMGLHAGLGLNAILTSTTNEIHSGDVVLFIPEYGLLADDGTGIFSSSFAAAIGRPGLGGASPKQIVEEVLLMGVPGSDRIVQSIKRFRRTLLFTKANPTNDNTNDSNGYENITDPRGNTMYLPIGNPQPEHVHITISEASLRRLVVFQNQVEEVGATLIFALPWIYSTGDSQSFQTAQATADTLDDIAPTLYNQTFNLKIEPALFGDTVYHLSHKGRELRSAELIQQLKFILISSDTLNRTTRSHKHLVGHF